MCGIMSYLSSAASLSMSLRMTLILLVGRVGLIERNNFASDHYVLKALLLESVIGAFARDSGGVCFILRCLQFTFSDPFVFRIFYFFESLHERSGFSCLMHPCLRVTFFL